MVVSAPTPLSAEQKAQKDKCTLFVGNVPVSLTNRSLESKFKQFGKIVSSRFRSCPVKDKYKGNNKKFGVMHQDYTEGVAEANLSQNAYIVYSSPEEVAAAVNSKWTGSDLFGSGHLVRLDFCATGNSGATKASPQSAAAIPSVVGGGSVKHFDRKKSVYVPRVPKTCTEKEIQSFIEGCHESLANTVRGVRVVRTEKNGNFAYVLFSERVHATTAVKTSGQDGLEFQGMKLRMNKIKKEEELAADKKKQLEEKAKAMKSIAKKSVSRLKWQARLTRQGNPKVVSHHAMSKQDRQDKMKKRVTGALGRISKKRDSPGERRFAKKH